MVHPERDMGRRIAHNIGSNNILDYLELSDEHSIVEIVADQKMNGKSIFDYERTTLRIEDITIGKT